MKLNIHISTYILIIASISTANAAFFQFTQGGFPENGAITGIFEARDIAGKIDDRGYPTLPDGIVSYCGDARCPDPSANDYVRLVSAHFSGNPMLEGLNRHAKELFLSGITLDPNNSAFNFLLLKKSSDCSDGCIPGDLPDILYNSGLDLIQINSASSYVSPYYVDKYGMEGSDQIYLDSNNVISISQVPLPSAFWLFSFGMIWLARWINFKQA